MIIEYCHACGLRIRQVDLDSGAAVRDREGQACCPQCRPARGKSSARQAASLKETASLPRGSTGRLPRESKSVVPAASGSATESAGMRRSRERPDERVRTGLPPQVMIGGGVAAVLLLILVVVLLNARTPPPRPAAQQEESAPAAPSIPAPLPVGTQVPGPPATPGTPEPPRSPGTPDARKSPGVEDIRENYARRLWDDLKGKAEGNPGARWSTARAIQDFVRSYGSTAAGKEAAAYLKAHVDDVPPLPTRDRSVANLKADFAAEQPKSGWQYLWNANGQIGSAANYKPLVWNPKQATYAGNADTYPHKGTPHYYVRLEAGGGHPGTGCEQKESGGIDRFAIAAYTLQSGQAGRIAIAGRLSCGHATGGVELRLYVNDEAKGSAKEPGGGAALEFATWLGDLNEGDTVYVAVGPNRNDGSDSFELSFTIYK